MESYELQNREDEKNGSNFLLIRSFHLGGDLAIKLKFSFFFYHFFYNGILFYLKITEMTSTYFISWFILNNVNLKHYTLLQNLTEEKNSRF